MNAKYFIKFIFPLSVLLVLILYLSLIPLQGTSTAKGKPKIDKNLFYHIIAYSFLSILFFRALNNSRFKIKAMALSFVLAFSYGLITELLQLLTTSRYFSFQDIAVNFLGSCIILFKGIFKK